MGDIVYAVKWVYKDPTNGSETDVEAAHSKAEALEWIANEDVNDYSPWRGVLVARPAPQPWTEVTN